MRIIFLTICSIMMVAKLNAQIYLGGSLGFSKVKFRGGEVTNTYKIIPEVGYSFNDTWSLGVSLGYKKGSCIVGNGSYGQNVESKVYGFQPYVRYNVFKKESIRVFVDGIFTYEKVIDQGTNMNCGLTPGLLFFPINNIGLVAHMGFLGFEYYKTKDGIGNSGIGGIDFDSGNFAFGVYYLF